jgi:hypothetical protein
MFMRRGASALGTAKPAVLLSDVATPRTGAMACKPQVDPAILLHRNPRAWEELLGWGCIEAFMERARGVGVRDLQSLVDYSFGAPSTMWILLAGVEFEGECAPLWEDYVRRRRVGMGARTPFPWVDVGVELDVDIRISPAYLLLPFHDVKRSWQRNAPTLLRYIPEIPTAVDPHFYISKFFPPQLRALSARGYVWVANTKSRGRRNAPLAEWLYWLNTGRMPHIDIMLGKFEPRSPIDMIIAKDCGGASAGCRQNKRRLKCLHFAGV